MQLKKNKNTTVFYFELIEQIAFCSYLENKCMKDFFSIQYVEALHNKSGSRKVNKIGYNVIK